MYYRRYERVRNTIPEIVEHAKAHRKNPTHAEAILWEALRGRRLCGAKFRRQHTVGNFILDFWCPEHRIAIEVDGEIHELPHIHAHDLERQTWIEAHQVRVLRFRNEQVIYQQEYVLAQIAQAIAPK